MNSRIILPIPSPQANKYSRGRAVFLAGSNRYPGSAALAALASQRIGAGYTHVFTTKAAVPLVRATSPSLVVEERAKWSSKDLSEVRQGHPSALCIGPGFTGSEKEEVLLQQALRDVAYPLLIDGGALGLLGSKNAQRLLAMRAEVGWTTVLTPHGGEAARLSKDLGIVETTPDGLATALAEATGALVVLKGPDTYIADGDSLTPMTAGTAALAKAGTGDVLSGMITGLLAQGIDGADAAFTGSYIHGQAGKYAADLYSVVAVTAEDVIHCIPAILKQLMDALPSEDFGAPLGEAVEPSPEERTSEAGIPEESV